AIALAYVNDDVRLVMVATGPLISPETNILLGLGDGKTFVWPDTLPSVEHATPVVADLNGDGAADVAVVNRQGDILLRLGRPGEPGAFAAPVVINPDHAARDLVVVRTPGGTLLA